jgi:hypothetical protein
MPLVGLCIFILGHNPNIVTSKHSTLVGKITILLHEGVDELCPFIVPLPSDQSWVKNELGDEPFSCLIMID